MLNSSGTRPLRTGALATIALLAATSPAGAASPADAIGMLNAQRATHAIPAGIVEVPAWSQACALHNAYQIANGGGLTHDEVPSRPGYTPQGAWAGQNSVLSQGRSWDRGNPWEHAPIHLHQLLHPRLVAMGVADAGGYVCATTHPGNSRPPAAAPTVYTYPGPGAAFRTRETADEDPYTPGEMIGIPRRTETGPYLYAMIDGPWSTFARARITQASLSGPEGPVAIRTVDNHTPGLEGYLPTGGELIPLRPLRARQTYTAALSATVTSADSQTPTPVAHQWSFTTLGLEPNVRIDAAVETRRGVRVSYNADTPAAAQVGLYSPSGSLGASAAVAKGQTAVMAVAPGRWTACYKVELAGDYDETQGCIDRRLDVLGNPNLRVNMPRRRGRVLSFALSGDPVLEGREVRVTITRVTRRGGGTRGAGQAQRSTVVFRRPTRVRVALPPRGRGVRVEVRVASFVIGDGRYASAQARRTYFRARR